MERSPRLHHFALYISPNKCTGLQERLAKIGIHPYTTDDLGNEQVKPVTDTMIQGITNDQEQNRVRGIIDEFRVMEGVSLIFFEKPVHTLPHVLGTPDFFSNDTYEPFLDKSTELLVESS